MQTDSVIDFVAIWVPRKRPSRPRQLAPRATGSVARLKSTPLSHEQREFNGAVLRMREEVRNKTELKNFIRK